MKYRVVEIDLLESYSGEKLMFSLPRIEDKLNKVTEDGAEIISVSTLWGDSDEPTLLVILKRATTPTPDDDDAPDDVDPGIN